MQKIILGIMVALMTIFSSLSATEKPKAVIIFDASGSMWGQIDGVNKITIARDALKSVVQKWNPNVELGLTVYGHRVKGDCNDIETLIPVGTVNKRRTIDTVMSIMPMGMTPIAKTLSMVANELKYTEQKATIILISDGKESCEADPCAVARQLEAKGIDFVTHVVGFGVDTKTDRQLGCIARATGGEYFSAKNASALNKAMKTIVKKVEKAKPKPKPKNNVEISASETKGGKWIKANHSVYKITNGAPANSAIASCVSQKKKPCVGKFPLGNYVMKSRYNQLKKETKFVVQKKMLSKVHVVMGSLGTVEITASETEGGKWVRAGNHIYKDDNGELGKSMPSAHSNKKKAGKATLPVGKYIVQSGYNKFKKLVPFEIKAGKVTKVSIVFSQTGKVETSASETEGGKWVKAYHWIYPMVDGVAEGGNIASAYSYKKKVGTAQIPVGKYLLKSKYNDFKKETSFEVKAGETVKLHIIMGSTGKVETSASETEGGKWVKAYHWIYPVVDGVAESGNIASAYSYKKKVGTAQIPAGKYLLKSKYNDFKKETSFEVKAGETVKLHIIMGSTGKVETSASETEGGKWVKAYHWIYPMVDGVAEGGNIASAYSYKKKVGTAQIPVGKYLLKSKYNDFKKETPFEVKSGETVKLHINFAPFHVSVTGIHKCSMIHHEVISARGQVVAEKKAPANRGADFVLPDGTYYLESTANGITKKNKIVIGGTGASRTATADFGGTETKGSTEGIWKTSEGKATIHLDGTKVHGNYSKDNGELVGEMTYPQRFEGFWIEDSSNTKCTEPKNGRYHWGKVIWEFDDDMCSFQGKWNYCNQKPSSNWRGTYLKSLPKKPTHQELIEADSRAARLATQKETQSKPAEDPKEVVETLGKMLGGVAEHADKKSVQDLKQAGAFFEALGSMMGGKQTKEQKEAAVTAQKQQETDNVKADKEFDTMSQELDMFTDK